MQSEEIFWRIGDNYREFDVSEMSLSAHVTMIGQGNSPFVGIPIFPSRYLEHSFGLLQRLPENKISGEFRAAVSGIEFPACLSRDAPAFRGADMRRPRWLDN